MASATAVVNQPSWQSKQEYIDDFLGRIAQRGVSAAFIRGHHGSGKSTTMVAHILNRVRDKVPGAPMLYLLPTVLEATWIREHLLSDQFNEKLEQPISDRMIPKVPKGYSLPAGTLHVSSYTDIFNLLREHKMQFPFGRKAVVLLDLEANPSTDGEVLFGQVLQWIISCREPGSPAAAAVVAISPFASKRTQAILDQVVGRKSDLIWIPKGELQQVPIPLTPLGEDWLAKVLKLVNEAAAAATKSSEDPEAPGEQSGRVLLSDSITELHQNFRKIDVLDSESIVTKDTAMFLKTSPVLASRPDLSFSLPLRGLRHFVSHDIVEDQVFDLALSQIISINRAPTRTEIVREQSWLFKSDLPLSDVVFHTTYDLEDFRMFTLGLDPPGRAYGADVFWTVLALIDAWPSKKLEDMPIRQPPNHHATEEAINRLHVLGCVGSTGSWDESEVKEIGSEMLRLKRDFFQEADFYVAYLLATLLAWDDQPSDSVRRVVIRLAAILTIGASAVCFRPESESSPDPALVGQFCRGVGAMLAHKGALWIALGVYQKAIDSLSIVETSAKHCAILEETPWLHLNSSALPAVQALVARLEKSLGLLPSDNLTELKLTELSHGQVFSIERRLMWAYLHRVIVHDGNSQSQPADAVSSWCAPVYEGEVIDLRALHADQRYFAIYGELAFNGEVFLAKGLTLIPSELYREVESRTNQTFDITVAPVYQTSIY